MINDDPRLSALVGEGKDGEVVIMGAPFDFTRKRTIHKGGEENGPCCLRRFFAKVGPLVNPQYGISIEGVKVTDYGNVQIQNRGDKTAPERAIAKISQQIEEIVRNNKVPFIFGGSKQGTYGASLAFSKFDPNHRHILIAGKPTLKRPFDEDKLTSDNLVNMLTRNRSHKLTLFGTLDHYFPKNYEKQFNLVSYRDIRTNKWIQSQLINTQGGFAMQQVLKSTSLQNIHVTLSVEAIERFRGCRDILSMGLQVQQILQIFLLLGMNKNVKLIDISEFNPSVEDYQSSLLLVNILYYFLMGWTKRSK